MKPKYAIGLSIALAAVLAAIAGCQTKGANTRMGPQPASQDAGQGSGSKPIQEGSGSR